MKTTTIQGVVDRVLVLRDRDLSSGAIQKLKEAFTKANPKYYKLLKMDKWVGNLDNVVVGYEHDDGVLMLPRGAIERVTEILAEHGIEVEWRDDTVKVPLDIDIKFKGKLRPYQANAVKRLTKPLTAFQTTGWPQYPNGTLRGPPGSGKTALSVGLIAERNVQTLVVVHSTVLLQQWREECARFLGFAPGTIQGQKVDIKPVTVAMQQTLWNRMGKRPPDYVRQFELIVIDECHHVSSRTYSAVAELFPGTQRIGVSADERRKDGMEFVTEWTVGPMLHEIKTEDLVDMGRLVPIEMTVVPTAYVDEIYLDNAETERSPDWGGMLTDMTKDVDRNQMIVDRAVRLLADEPGAKILILTERVEHVHMLHGQLFLHGVRVGKMLGGADNHKELERTKRGLQTGRLQVGIGTRVADEGLDIPALTDVFLTCPVHTHPKRVRQMVGRAARPHGDKKIGRATYFWDRLMFPPYPEGDERRERGEQNFVGKLEKGVGPTGTVKVEKP